VATPDDTILDYFERVYMLDRPLRASTAYQYRHALRLFSAWLGGPPRLAQMSADALSRWLMSLESRYAAVSIWDHRRAVIIVWSHAAKNGLCPEPRNVRRPARAIPMPIAWTLEELRKILAACDALSGVFPSGAPRRDYCLALIHAAWDSGLRRSDLWSLTRNAIRPDGVVLMRQLKTSMPHHPRLRPETVAKIISLPGDRPLRCPFGSPRWWYRFWDRRVISAAGVRPGCLQQLRRTGATHLAIDHPEAVQRYLGHASPEMQKHYVDWSIAKPQQYLPPEL
jgi:integrase